MPETLDEELVLPLMTRARTVVGRLIDGGLISAAEIVRHGISIRQFRRKNLSFRVETRSRTCLVKVAKQPEDDSVAREARVYELLTRRGAPVDFGNHLPALLDYDVGRRMLVLEWVEGQTLHDYHRLEEPPHAYLGRQLGELLGALHGLPVEDFAAPPPHTGRPWVLSFAAPPVEILATESSGIVALTRRLQGSPPLLRALDEVGAAWDNRAVCHHDVRLHNVLHATAPSPRVVLIDWELCAPGHYLWDLACFFESYVQLWALSRSSSSGPGASRSIAYFQQLLGACWSAYRERATHPGIGQTATIRLVARMIAVKLVQSALEYAQQSNDPTRESIMLLETSKKFCEQPLEAWVHILGIPLTRRTGSFTLVP
jgi:Ser/Thr protein kinase RdoA (MazF antagonist)